MTTKRRKLVWLLIAVPLAMQSGCSGQSGFAFGKPVGGLRVGFRVNSGVTADSVFFVQVENVGSEWKTVRLMYPNLRLEVVDDTGYVVATLSGDEYGTFVKVAPIDGTTSTVMPPKSIVILQLQGNEEVLRIKPGTYYLRASLYITDDDWTREMRLDMRGSIEQLWAGECQSGSFRVSL